MVRIYATGASDCPVCHITRRACAWLKRKIAEANRIFGSGLRSSTPAIAVIPLDLRRPRAMPSIIGAACEIKNMSSSRNRHRLHSPRAAAPASGPRSHPRRRVPRPAHSGFHAGWSAPTFSCGCCFGCTSAWPSAMRRGRCMFWDQNPFFCSFHRSRSMPANGAVRGLVSGLGLLNLWIAFQDAIRHRGWIDMSDEKQGLRSEIRDQFTPVSKDRPLGTQTAAD